MFLILFDVHCPYVLFTYINLYVCIYIYTLKVFIHLTNDNPVVICNLPQRLGKIKGRITYLIFF